MFGFFKRPRADQCVDPQSLRTELRQGPLKLIDVREPGEFATGHIAGARNMPLSRLDVDALPEGRIVFVCHSGMRSGSACKQAAAAGRRDARNLAGGMIAWLRDGGQAVVE